MAQWMGQFSGNTHGSRVRELELQLRHAIDVLRDTASATDLAKRHKSISRTADRLLSARIRLRKSIVRPQPDETDPKLQTMIDGGVAAIYEEFGIDGSFDTKNG